ncbi:Uncharacterized protein APZ42_009197 [Daphnia magna]|uniref:Uncharacterized protein n=1 Tax=Daphnia magna TaxID=35525 RepID=A0A164E5M7_9CRUS|nr:Uncharacterized protein APZ42_009197 [Daphnia magna]
MLYHLATLVGICDKHSFKYYKGLLGDRKIFGKIFKKWYHLILRAEIL